MKRVTRWKRGQKSELARLAGISPQYLSDILHRRKRAGWDLAGRLATAATVLELPLSRYDFIASRETLNPLFSGRAINNA